MALEYGIAGCGTSPPRTGFTLMLFCITKNTSASTREADVFLYLSELPPISGPVSQKTASAGVSMRCAAYSRFSPFFSPRKVARYSTPACTALRPIPCQITVETKDRPSLAFSISTCSRSESPKPITP